MFSFIKSLLGKLLLEVVKSNFCSDELRIRLVKMLLACGANPNVQDSDGNTSLHIAIKKGDHEMAELLISLGAHFDYKEINYCNSKGYTQMAQTVSFKRNGDPATELQSAQPKDNNKTKGISHSLG